ncbi:hypothetical protein VTN31DRAFT_6709 [Thermomyces dupontii]|uniref:uncharacterized protein n=1 Tax=Talaromyces thermophilus TaxID=28565 RepID=UPI003742A264
MEFLEGKRKGRSIDAELTPHPPVVRGVVWKYYPQRYNLVLDSHKIGEVSSPPSTDLTTCKQVTSPL